VDRSDGAAVSLFIAVLDQLWPYFVLAATAFLAATLVPLSSEVALVAVLKSGLGAPAGFLLAASIGNVGGCLFNWWLGLNLRRFEGRRWFPLKPGEIDRAAERFRRWGTLGLLFSWVPIVGDPLTLVAGVLRVPLTIFLPLVALGRVGRYLVVAALA
jgi:membrane protein YqaA with SNARE-associated domain